MWLTIAAMVHGDRVAGETFISLGVANVTS